MDKKQSLAFLLSAMMVATPFSAFAAENGEDASNAGNADATATAEQQKSAVSTQSNEGASNEGASTNEGSDEAEVSDKWEASDFTYGDWEIGANERICPSDDTTDYLKTTVHVVTGFSESGTKKLEKNKNLVIPAKDTDGKKIQGVGANAFKNLGLESVEFPENVKTANDTDWDSSVKERGDFFIGSTAFYGNNLTELTLPEGVIYVGGTAFRLNKNLKKVNFPSTIKVIANQSFGQCAIEKLNFTETTDFPLCIDNIAFAYNKITSVWLPDNTEKVTGMAFCQSSGKVALYIRKTNGGFIENNSYQQPYIGDAIPAEAWAEKPWSVEHFTFDGTTITGLSDNGKAKIKTDTNLILPDKNADGEYVTAIGNGTSGVGTFGYKDSDGTVYAPDSVKLPSKLESIGNFAFSATIVTSTSEVLHGLKEITFPGTLKTIGTSAFQNAPLSEVVLPDSVTTVGNGAFVSNDKAKTKITKVTLSKNLSAIPASMFTSQAIKEVEIPEGVTSIGMRAFAGNYVEKVTIPDTVTSIGNYAFQNNQLQKVEIPSKVKSIGSYVFQRTNEDHSATIKEIILHEGLESIGTKAFGQAVANDCKGVELPTTVKTLNANAFDGNKTVTLLSIVADQVNGTGDYTKVIPNGTGHEIVFSHTITFDAGKGTAETATARTHKNGNLTELPTATLQDYVLEGWYTAEDGGDKVTTDTTFDEDTTLYAHWEKAPVDTTAADKAKEAVSKLTKSDYTEESWKTVEDAKTALDEAIAGGLQSKVDAATDNLNKAVEALAKADLNKDAADKATEAVSKLTKTDYTADSWKTVEDAQSELDKAIAGGLQSRVDAAVEKLNKAVDDLQKVDLNKDAADKATEAVSKMNKSDYTEESWKAVEDAKTALDEAIAGGLQSKVDAAVEKLNKAVDALAKADLNKDAADKATEAVSKLNKTDYTADSWKAVEDAQSELDKAIAGGLQSKVDAAVEKLNKAVDALAKADLNKSDADKATEAVSKLNKDDYTADSWKAVEDAKTALDEAIAGGLQSKVDAAVEKLNKAVEGLVKVEKPVDVQKISSITLSTTTYTYSGKVKTPSVIVKDAAGKKISSSEYTVKYATGRKNVGKYTVTVTLKNGAKNTVSASFRILPKKTSIKSLKKGKKSFTAKWTKQKTQVTGYQVQYSNSKKFTKKVKTKTIKSYKTTSKKVTKLSKKKTYYVRVRTYKKVGKTTYHAAWSKVKKVKTK